MLVDYPFHHFPALQMELDLFNDDIKDRANFSARFVLHLSQNILQKYATSS